MELTNNEAMELTNNDVDDSSDDLDLAIESVSNWQQEAGTLEPTVGGSCSNCSNCCGDSVGF